MWWRPLYRPESVDLDPVAQQVIRTMKWKKLLQPARYWSGARFVFTLVWQEFREWLYTFVMALPGEIGSMVRKRVIPFKSIGRAVMLRRGGYVFHPEKVTIGDYTRFNIGVIINGAGGVEIGKNVRIGPRALIYSQNHNYEDATTCIAEQGYSYAKVVIEDDVWLCAGAMVLPGVRVGKGTVVAAGSVVTKETEPYSIVAGAPAVKVGERR
jgi:maltose O-acetyltransferase